MKQTKPNLIYAMSVCLSLWVWPSHRRPSWRGHGVGQPGGHPIVGLCPDGWPRSCLSLVFYFLISSSSKCRFPLR